jgi:hypothetical protein
MNSWSKALRNTLPIAGLTGATTVVAAALCGWRENDNAVAPLNAVSHIVWGDEATTQENISTKYTATGVALNVMAMFGWALIFAKLFPTPGKLAKRAASSFSGGALVSLLAYIVDYHLVPKRLTPGIESRLSCGSLLVIYIVLALSLGLGGLLTDPEEA